MKSVQCNCLLLACLLCSITSLSAIDFDIRDGDITTSVTWTPGNVYFIHGIVYLKGGVTLTIMPGTVVKFMEHPTNGDGLEIDERSALVVTRDASLQALGTYDERIIFTSDSDDPAIPDDLGAKDKGLWGGIFLLGYGTVSTATGLGEIEGLENSLNIYGNGDVTGPIPETNSTLTFVSIRHAGAMMASTTVSGLTLAGIRDDQADIIGVEVFASAGDGICFLGGDIKTEYTVIAFCDRDGCVIDQGWAGEGQNWFVVSDCEGSEDGAEHREGINPVVEILYPEILNVTFLGPGFEPCEQAPQAASAGPGLLQVQSAAVKLVENATAAYKNSIFSSYTTGILLGDTLEGGDSDAQYRKGLITFSNNIWADFSAANNEPRNFIQTISGQDPDLIVDIFNAGQNDLYPKVGNVLNRVSYVPNQKLDPTPPCGSPALENYTKPKNPELEAKPYRGAFNFRENWALGWTAVDELGYFPETGVKGQKVITDQDLRSGIYTWTKDTVYILDGLVFLEGDGVLNITAGTLIKAREYPTNGDPTSALIIGRGARMFALGAKEDPIVFTAEADNPYLDDLSLDDQGLWGGVFILGRSKIASSSVETVLKGFSPDDTRAYYGGNNAWDNSGELAFVSIRHAGYGQLGDQPFSALTFAGVGSATSINFVEVLAGGGRGIEFLGGTARAKFLSSSFCMGDAFSWDLGWKGMGQFWFALLAQTGGRHGGIFNGGAANDPSTFSDPILSNLTFIGPGCSDTLRQTAALFFRSGSAGKIVNSIFTGFKKGVEVEDLPSGIFDSRQQLLDTNLLICSNLWGGFCSGDAIDPTGIVRVSSGTPEDPTAQFLVDHLVDRDNIAGAHEMLISRTRNGALDPLPGMLALADTLFNPNVTIKEDVDFFTPVCFKGAFGQSKVWLQDWTSLAQYYILDCTKSFGGSPNDFYDVENGCFEKIINNQEELFVEQKGYYLFQNFPNPVSSETNIRFSLPENDQVVLTVYDLQGRALKRPIDGEYLHAGEHVFSFNAEGLSDGIYYYNLRTRKISLTKEMVIMK